MPFALAEARIGSLSVSVPCFILRVVRIFLNCSSDR